MELDKALLGPFTGGLSGEESPCKDWRCGARPDAEAMGRLFLFLVLENVTDCASEDMSVPTKTRSIPS